MKARGRRLGFDGGGKPVAPGSWLFGLVVGLTVTNLAAGAMILGTGAAIGKAMAGGIVPVETSRKG